MLVTKLLSLLYSHLEKSLFFPHLRSLSFNMRLEREIICEALSVAQSLNKM